MYQEYRAYLDGNDEVSTILQEELRVQGDNPALIRLSNISKDTIHHWNEHPIPGKSLGEISFKVASSTNSLVRVPGILNDGHHVGPLLCHIQKVATRPGQAYIIKTKHKGRVQAMIRYHETVNYL